MPQLVNPCVVTSQLQLVMVWAVVLSAVFLAWPFLAKLSARAKQMVAVPMLVMGMVLGGALPAFATIPTPESCYWLQASGAPCWLLQAMWCPCGEDPPPPPPPPNG